MSKIVAAINAMISRAENISNVIETSQMYFFLYKGIYKWSIRQMSSDYALYYYPEATDLSTIASAWGGNYNWENIIYVIYSTEEYKSQEAVESFQELYKIVQEKLYGVDDVLKQIIEDLPF